MGASRRRAERASNWAQSESSRRAARPAHWIPKAATVPMIWNTLHRPGRLLLRDPPARMRSAMRLR